MERVYFLRVSYTLQPIAMSVVLDQSNFDPHLDLSRYMHLYSVQCWRKWMIPESLLWMDLLRKHSRQFIMQAVCADKVGYF